MVFHVLLTSNYIPYLLILRKPWFFHRAGRRSSKFWSIIEGSFPRQSIPILTSRKIVTFSGPFSFQAQTKAFSSKHWHQESKLMVLSQKCYLGVCAIWLVLQNKAVLHWSGILVVNWIWVPYRKCYAIFVCEKYIGMRWFSLVRAFLSNYEISVALLKGTLVFHWIQVYCWHCPIPKIQFGLWIILNYLFHLSISHI